MIPCEILKKIRQIGTRANRIVTGVTRICLIFSILLLFCSCAVEHLVQAQLPADLKINQHAGRGDLLYVMIRLENGEHLPFVLDTGSPVTIFDASLEPKLRKRLGSMTAWNFGGKRAAGVYAAPKLYLGKTLLLMTGSNILTCDFQAESSVSGADYPVMGILGMDVLEHYCVQLDFEARAVRFLPPENLTPTELGRQFPLDIPNGDARAFVSAPLLLGNERKKILVDTGFQGDGASNSEQFDMIVQARSLKMVRECALFPNCDWNGQNYTNLIILKGEGLLGLRFLARHLVTLNFPNRTMYLKQQNVGPLDNNMEAYFIP